MKIQMGQPQRLVNAANSSFTDRLKLKEGENIHRVLFGPVVVNTVFWPSTQKEEDGSIKQVTKSAKVPDRGSLFEGIAALDRKIQRANGEDKPRSALDRKTNFNYLVIDTDSEPLSVQIAQYPKTIKDRLVEIQNTRDRDDATKLRYGLIWMFNNVLTKEVDPRQSKLYGTSYKVDPYPKNPWIGQVPADWLKADFNDLIEGGYIDLEEVFTPEMLQAIEEADIDLEAEGIPDSEEIIFERLAAFPIDLSAQRDGNPMFAQAEVLMEELKTLEIPFIRDQKSASSAPQLTTGNKNTPVEADYEIVDEAPSDHQEEASPFPKANKKIKKEIEPEEEEEDEEDEEETPPPKKKRIPSGLEEDTDEQPVKERPSKLKSLVAKANKMKGDL